MLEMVGAFENVSGRKVLCRIAPRGPSDIATLFAVPTKAERKLSWKAKRSLHEMIRDAWRWQWNPNGFKTEYKQVLLFGVSRASGIRIRVP